MKHLKLGLGILAVAGMASWAALARDGGDEGASTGPPATSSTTTSASVPPPTTEPALPAPVGPLGVFVGTDDPEGVAEFEQWLGRRVTWAMDYIGRSSGGDAWAGIDDPSGRCAAWVDGPWRMVLSVAMLPTDRQHLAAGAAGDYDHHWRRFGEALVDGGCGDWVLRLGWEFNGRFYPWSAGGQEEEFVAYWRRIVATLRRVEGQRFTFDWTPLAGNANADVEAAYPGDDVVDVIGLDAYDTSSLTDPEERWADQLDRRYGLRWHADFAAAHGKRMSFPEWGVTVREGDALGGGDARLYMERMLDWISRHDVRYALYFDVDASDAAHRLSAGRFPEAAAVLLRWSATRDHQL